jgi:hypothetical protein
MSEKYLSPVGGNGSSSVLLGCLRGIRVLVLWFGGDRTGYMLER